MSLEFDSKKGGSGQLLGSIDEWENGKLENPIRTKIEIGKRDY
jgi:hypothetical protein